MVEIFDLSSASVVLFPLQKPTLFVARLSLGAFVAKHLDLRVAAVNGTTIVRVRGVRVDLQMHGNTLIRNEKKKMVLI